MVDAMCALHCSKVWDGDVELAVAVLLPALAVKDRVIVVAGEGVT